MQNNSVILVHHQKNGIMMAFAGGLIVDFLESKRAVIFLRRNVVMINIKKEKQITHCSFSGEGDLVICASDYSSGSDLRL